MPGPGPLRAATMAALLVLTPLGMPAAQERPSEGDAKARVDAIKHDIQALDTRLEDTRAARSDAGRQLEKVETALGEIHHRLDTLQAERRQLDDEIASLEARQRELQAQQAAQRQALGEQVAALYRLGDTPQLKLLLNQDEPARLDRMQTYLNYLAEARRERIEALARLDRELADNRASLTQRRARLDTLVSELDAQSAALASRMRERQALVAKLDARYA
ncbi:peptidase M23, partial [Halomonas sp. BBD48]|nr:peptidase M23 [Halomonas sp. BBD48]